MLTREEELELHNLLIELDELDKEIKKLTATREYVLDRIDNLQRLAGPF